MGWSLGPLTPLKAFVLGRLPDVRDHLIGGRLDSPRGYLAGSGVPNPEISQDGRFESVSDALKARSATGHRLRIRQVDEFDIHQLGEFLKLRNLAIWPQSGEIRIQQRRLRDGSDLPPYSNPPDLPDASRPPRSCGSRPIPGSRAGVSLGIRIATSSDSHGWAGKPAYKGLSFFSIRMFSFSVP